MFRLQLLIQHPFKKEDFKNIFSRSRAISKNKIFEFEVIRYRQNLIEFYLDLNYKGLDHAGPNVEIGIFGYAVQMKVYDHRHWNYETETWQGCELDSKESTK